MKKAICISILSLILSVPVMGKGCSIIKDWTSPSGASGHINWGDTIRIPYPDTTFHLHLDYCCCNGPEPGVGVLMVKDPQLVTHTSMVGEYDFTQAGAYGIYEFMDLPAYLHIKFYVVFSPPVVTTNIIENTINTVSIYPNPFADNLTIKMSEGNTPELQIRIFALDGRLVLEHTYTDVSSCTLVTSTLVPGIYIAEIRTRETTLKQKILKTGS